MITLYLKIHNQTGYMYLGKTTQDPQKYTGSGIKWKRHLAKHGKDVTTLVLFESESPTEVKNQGIFYSEYFDVVSSNDFANMTVEQGDGGNNIIWDDEKREAHKKIMLKVKSRPGAREKRYESLQETWTSEKRKIHSQRMKEVAAEDPSIVERNRQAALLRHQTGAYSDAWSEQRRKTQSERISGKNNPMFGKEHSTKAKQAISKSLQDKLKTHAHKEAIGTSLTGYVRPKTHHCRYCNRFFTKVMYNRWHGERCKNKEPK